MPNELTQRLVNAVLLLVVAFVGGTLGLRRFEAIERSIAGLRTESKSETGDLRAELRADTAGLRTKLKADIAELRTELKTDIAEFRGEQAQMRSDLTIVARAVGARSAAVSLTEMRPTRRSPPAPSRRGCHDQRDQADQTVKDLVARSGPTSETMIPGCLSPS
jgi:ribosomal protein L29